MAKKDLEVKWSSDHQKVVDGFAKVIAKNEQAIAKLKQTNRESKKAKQSMSGMGKTIGDISKMAAGFFSAQTLTAGFRAAFNIIKSEYEDLRRKEREAGKANIDYAKNFANIISTWLGTGMVDKAHQALTKAVKQIPELSFTKGAEILGAYGAARPKAGLARGMEAVRLAAPMAAWEKPEEVARLVAELEELMPGKEMEDIFDIAVKMRKSAGKLIAQLAESMKGVHQLKAYGIPVETGLGVIMAMLDKELKPRAMTTMLGLLARPIEPVGIGKGKIPTPKQAIQNELAALWTQYGEKAPAEVFKWAQQQPEKAKFYYGTTFAPVAPIFEPGAIAAGTEAIQRAQREDEYRRELGTARKQSVIQLSATEVRHQARMEKLRMGYKEGGMRGIAARRLEETFAAMPQVGATERKLIQGAIEVNARLFGEDYTRAVNKQMVGLYGKFSEEKIMTTRLRKKGMDFVPFETEIINPDYDPQAARAIVGATRDINEAAAALKGMGEFDKWQPVTKEMDDTMKKLTSSLDKNTQALEKINQRIAVGSNVDRGDVD